MLVTGGSWKQPLIISQRQRGRQREKKRVKTLCNTLCGCAITLKPSNHEKKVLGLFSFQLNNKNVVFHKESHQFTISFLS